MRPAIRLERGTFARTIGADDAKDFPFARGKADVGQRRKHPACAPAPKRSQFEEAGAGTVIQRVVFRYRVEFDGIHREITV